MKSFKDHKAEKLKDQIYRSRENSEHLRDKQRDYKYKARKTNSDSHQKKSTFYGRKAREQERTTSLIRRRLDSHK